jgi:hypothetical protein
MSRPTQTELERRIDDLETDDDTPPLTTLYADIVDCASNCDDGCTHQRLQQTRDDVLNALVG